MLLHQNFWVQISKTANYEIMEKNSYKRVGLQHGADLIIEHDLIGRLGMMQSDVYSLVELPLYESSI